MRVLITNPKVISVIRRRHTTIITLRERGQDLELMFTSLKVLDDLAADVSEAVDSILAGEPGTQWVNPRIPPPKRNWESEESADLLYDAGVLERPAFLRPKAPRVERVGNQDPDSNPR